MRLSMIFNVPRSNWLKTWSAWTSLGRTELLPSPTSTTCVSWIILTSLSQTLFAQSPLSGSENSQDLKEGLQNLPSCEALDRLQLSMTTSAILKSLKPEMPRKLSILLCRTNNEPLKPNLSEEDSENP